MSFVGWLVIVGFVCLFGFIILNVLQDMKPEWFRRWF